VGEWFGVALAIAVAVFLCIWCIFALLGRMYRSRLDEEATGPEKSCWSQCWLNCCANQVERDEALLTSANPTVSDQELKKTFEKYAPSASETEEAESKEAPSYDKFRQSVSESHADLLASKEVGANAVAMKPMKRMRPSLAPRPAALVRLNSQTTMNAEHPGAMIDSTVEPTSVGPQSMDSAGKPILPRRPGKLMRKSMDSSISLDEEGAVITPSSEVNFEKLPPGWSRKISDQGQPYYVNEETGASQWELPTVPAGANVKEGESAPAIAAGWELSTLASGEQFYRSPSQGTQLLPNWQPLTVDQNRSVYFFNTIDQRSQWDAPVAYTSQNL